MLAVAGARAAAAGLANVRLRRIDFEEIDEAGGSRRCPPSGSPRPGPTPSPRSPATPTRTAGSPCRG